MNEELQSNQQRVANKSALLIVVRFIIALAVGAALPVAYSTIQPSTGIEGPSAFSALIISGFMGVAIAGGYFIASTIAFHYLRHRPWRLMLTIDCCAGIVLIVLLVWSGLTATYEDLSAASHTPATQLPTQER